jgi:replicative DNA helicase
MTGFNPQISSNALPPQNIEAEESILGGILLDPEAISRILDVLVPEAFYVKAHKEIYEATLKLHAQGKPTDLMSVTSWLSDHHLLEQVGGTLKLVQLLDRTVSAVNIDRYAALIMDKYLRRQLIFAGHEIVDLGFDTAIELDNVLDESEKKIFRLTQKRPQEGLIPISDTLVQTFSDIEKLHQKLAQPGIPCGFYDLDAMTSGFGRSDLIIIAGRPSMGKCLAKDSEIVLADGSVETIEEIYYRRQAELLTLKDNWKLEFTKPSAFIDDGIKPVFQVITRLGRKIETTITHPYLTITGWRKLAELKSGDKIAVPRKFNVFGNEKLDESQVKILAYLIGDGCLTHISPQFTNSNSILQEDFTEAVAIFPGVKVRKETSQGTRTTTLYVTKNLDYLICQRQLFAQALKVVLQSQSLTIARIAQAVRVNVSTIHHWLQGRCVPNQTTYNLLCKFLQIDEKELSPHGLVAIAKNSKNSLTIWLQELGLWGKNAHQKTIPAFVFKLKRSLVALFLNRLFATDGWITVLDSGQVQLGYATVSEKLARQIQHLLLRFGVIAKLKKRSIKYKNTSKNAWQLDITDSRSLKTFIDEIGIFGKEKAIALAKESLTYKRYQSNCDLIPIEIWQQLAIAKGQEPWSLLAKRANFLVSSNIHVNRRALSRERLFALALALDNLSLQQLATSDIYWDEIISIEYVGKKQVYDLTISETHNFVANDICVHNTSFALNIAHNVAKDNLPVAIFSLEMSKEQLALRLLASEAGIESNKLRSGRLSQKELEPLFDSLGSLSTLPIFIDDAANATVLQMRSQVRRLQAEHKGQLGLVLIDYLQLMEGGGDNRVQELSKITRSLKGLAREVGAPVIALSQLSRAVESRTNKRPMMSDLRESGCLTGDSLVTMADTGIQVPIRELVGKAGFTVWALNEATMQLESAVVSNAFATGVKPVLCLKTRLGRTIRATGNHKFLTIHGWQRLDRLQISDRIALPRHLPSLSIQSLADTKIALLGHLIGDGCTLPRHIIQYTTREKDLANIVALLATEAFENQVIPRICKERDWYQVYLSAAYHLTHKIRNPIAEWLDSLGAFGLRSYEKFVPTCVFEQPQELIALFLRHLWSTDGCIRPSTERCLYPAIYYSSSSEQLSRDVQSLLLRLCINARLKMVSQLNKGRNQYQVWITGKPDLEKFIELIGAVGSYKKQALTKIAEYLEIRFANTNRDIIPCDIWKLYAVPSMKKNGITIRQMQSLLGMAHCGTTLYKQNVSRERAIKIASVVRSDEIKYLANSDIYWDEIVSIEADGEAEVYDLTVPNFHNFIANNIVVHNSIEQDADLIIMLYRDEYYHQDTPDRGLAEVIITKHRNGPTGTVKLLFQPELTKFLNLQRKQVY